MVVGLAELSDYVRRNLEAKNFPQRHPENIFATFKKYSISAPKPFEKHYENCIKNLNWLRNNPEKVRFLEQKAADRRANRYRGRDSPPYRGRGSPNYRGRGSPSTKGRGSPTWKGRGSPTRGSPNRWSSPSHRGRGSPTYKGRGRGRGRYSGTYRGRGRGDSLNSFSLPPSHLYHQQRGRGGAYHRSRSRGRRAPGQSRSDERWSTIEKKISNLEMVMSELFRKEGLPLPVVPREMGAGMSFKEFVDLSSGKNGVSINNSQEQHLLTLQKVSAVQLRVYNRVKEVMGRAAEIGVLNGAKLK